MKCLEVLSESLGGPASEDFSCQLVSLQEPLLDTDEEWGCRIGRASAWALLTQVDRSTESRRVRTVSARVYDFMIVVTIKYFYCLMSENDWEL